jgi:preprotein translocase subunit SecE
MAKEEETYPDLGLGVGLRATFRELRRVVWPTRPELFRMTGVVVGTVVAIALFIAVIDAGLLKGANLLYGAK